MESPSAAHSIPGRALSAITPIGYRRSLHCGYCKTSTRANKPPQRSHSYYVRSNSLDPECYQVLVDRCWRRSGNLLYRPNQNDCCCPHYTIRLDTSQFHASRDQRQTLNRFNKHVLGERYVKEAARRHPKSREEAKRRNTEFDLLGRVHESEAASLPQPPAPDHTFTVTLETNDFTEEKYECYENYQRLVHHETPEDIDRDGFKRFLCDSPLERTTIKSLVTGKDSPLGSFHQCYRLDGKLVAVSVLDLLPHCVSGVYFFYHESISQWSPGKLSALREIALAQENGYRYWYPGYYIHTCPKMKYKRDFKPQTILDPESLDWVPFNDETAEHFDWQGYLNFSEIEGTKSARKVKEGSLVYDKRDPQYSKPTIGATNSAEGGDKKKNDRLPDFDAALFRSSMPAMTSPLALDSKVLDNIIVKTNFGSVLAAHLFRWQDEEVDAAAEDDEDGMGPTPKILVAELISLLGEDMVESICLDLTKG